MIWRWWCPKSPQHRIETGEISMNFHWFPVDSVKLHPSEWISMDAVNPRNGCWGKFMVEPPKHCWHMVKSIKLKIMRNHRFPLKPMAFSWSLEPSQVHGLHTCGGGPPLCEGCHWAHLLLWLGLHLGVPWFLWSSPGWKIQFISAISQVMGLEIWVEMPWNTMLNLWSAPPSRATGTFWTPPWQDKAHVRPNTSPISCAIHEIRVCSAMHCLTLVSLVGKVVVKHHCSLLDWETRGNMILVYSGHTGAILPWGHGSSCWAALSSSLHIWRIPRRRPWFSTLEVAVEVLTCVFFQLGQDLRPFEPVGHFNHHT